jgi:hypothetical protein
LVAGEVGAAAGWVGLAKAPAVDSEGVGAGAHSAVEVALGEAVAADSEGVEVGSAVAADSGAAVVVEPAAGRAMALE